MLRAMTEHEREAHQEYIRALRQLTPERRLQKAFELSDFGRDLFVHGLRKSFPHLSEPEFQILLKDRLTRCHNRNY